MKIFFAILFSFFVSTAFSQVLVGYIKSSSSFLNTNAIGLTNVTTAAYINSGKFQQVGIGSVIRDAGGTPINGGFFWWGYSTTSGGSSLYRGYKISDVGVVTDFVAQTSGPNKMIPIAYHNNSGASSCGAGGSYTNAIYGAVDDPGLYENKPVFSSDGGGTYTNGTLFTAAWLSGGSSYWTFTYSSTNSKATSVACCSSNPLSYAGADAIYELTASQIPLSGKGVDCNGTITYSWSRISGPNTPAINNSAADITYITGFIVGTYVYRLTITDNSSNTATDDVSITVFPTPLSTNPQKIHVDTLMVYGLEGEDGRGTDNSGYFFDEDADPRNGVFDFNTITGGLQKQQTSGKITRLTHDWHRSGLGRQIEVEWDTVKYITKLYIYDTTQEAGHTVKFYIGNTAKLQKARWPWIFGSQAADYTYTTKNTPGWDSIPMTGQDSGSKVIMELDNFAIDVTAVFYGATSTYNTLDTAITRKTNVSIADTAVTLYDLHRINNDGALPLNNPNYPRDSLTGYSWERFYYVPIKLGNTLAQINGMFDPDSVAWTVGNPFANTNQIDVGPFGTATGPDNPYITDSIVHLVGGKGILMNVRGTNGFYTSHSGYNPEHYPKNDVTSNPRTRQAWERDAYAKESLIAKFFQTTSPANPTKYRYKNDRWPGQFGLNFFSPIFEVDNEKDEGFRSDSAYMTPEMIGFHGSVVYDTCKALQPSLTMLTQAYVTGNVKTLRSAIKNMQLFNGSRKKWFDGVSMHGNVFEEEYRHSPTSEDLRFQHGALAGKHGERNRTLSDITMISQELGYYSPFYFTEIAYTEDSIGPTAADFSDGSYSLCGAVPIKSYDADTSLAINLGHYFFHLAVPQVKGIWKYTTMDAVGPASIFRFNADARAGIADYTAVGTGGGRILHPSYYFMQAIALRFPDWEWADSVANFNDGYFIDKWWKKSNHDSAFYVVFNQDRVNAVASYTLPVGNASTVTRLQPPFGSLSMINAGTVTITNNTISPVGRPEMDFYVFVDANQSPTANAGSDQGIVLPINTVIVNGSFSTDPDGTISTYAWTKISGPSTYTIVSPSSAITTISNLVEGAYVFRLTVTDNEGATATDDVTITVAPAAPIGPILRGKKYVVTN